MNLIKIFTAMLVILVSTGCETQQTSDGYVINGVIEGLEKGTVEMGEIEVPINNGRFELKGKLEAPEMTYIKILPGDYGASFFIENVNMKVTLDVKSADERGNMTPEISGSPVNDEYNQIKDILQGFESSKELARLYDELQSTEDDDRKKELEELMSEAREQTREARALYILRYTIDNPGSVVAAFYMQFQANDADQTFEEFKAIVEGFDSNVQKTSIYKGLKRKLEALIRTRPGSMAPDFTLKTNQGEDFTLSSIRGKVVLVDFWASWCIPCRKAFPGLKEIYRKYKDKGFEIVGVTNDRIHDAWKKAIADDGITWIQVADEFPEVGPPYTANVITSFAAPYLPTTYLLDREGKIVAKNLHKEELEVKLNELLNQKLSLQ